MNVNAIVFDLDGTLLDTLDDLTAAVNHALAAFGLSAVDKARVRRYVGNGVPKLIDRVLRFATSGVEPSGDDTAFPDRALANACLAVFTEYYDAHNADFTAPYAGIVDMLDELKEARFKTAIVTNKYDAAAQMLYRKFFGSVDVAVGASDDIRPKPAPDGVYKALGVLGVDKRDAVYVGDGETDIKTAKNCGMPVIAVSWGFRDKQVLKTLEPDCIIDSPSEILGAIETLKKR